MLAPQVAAKRRVVATLETGRMPGHDLDVEAGRRGFVAETEEAVGREEELRDRAVGAGVDLALQILEVERRDRSESGWTSG